MEAVMSLSTEIEYSCTFRDSLTSLYKVVTAEVRDIMASIGEKDDEYYISIHPLSIERIDGKPVPNKLIDALSRKFSL